jgi:hypothetical protein
MNEIKDFRKEYFFLSNFYMCHVHVEGITYPSSEHAYMAMKTLDPEERIRFSNMKTAREARDEGQKVKLRGGWEVIKNIKMKDILSCKFTQNPDINKLRERLLATGDAYLEEGNTWHDNYWGVCYCDKCKDKEKHNMLGKLLMEVRDEIKQSEVKIP